MNTTRPAFTLIEVLLVIAIMTLFAAIVVAASGPAREAARQDHCISNLHQFGLATTIYRSDWDGEEAIRGQAMQPAQLGLPIDQAFVGTFLKSYVGDAGLLLDCPDFEHVPGSVGS